MKDSLAIEARLARMRVEHRRGIRRFLERIEDACQKSELSRAQADVVVEHVVRLGERDRNPANTGNVEDLFFHTLVDTRDPIRAFAQALADSVKIVPMEREAQLDPPMRTLDGGKILSRVSDFDFLSPADTMLVTHTMVAYGDREMTSLAAAFVRATSPKLDDRAIDRAVAKMAVQSQHLPSSTFVLSRAAGITVECTDLYRRAGYDESTTRHAQHFYDVGALFEPAWANDFVAGDIPTDAKWGAWRAKYVAAREELPIELKYQLVSDTLTNFLDGTLESGKWTDACVVFGGVSGPEELPAALARIVNQYLAEHVALHNRPAHELTIACAKTLGPWGVGFDGDRAIVTSHRPERSDLLREQFEAAVARKMSGS